MSGVLPPPRAVPGEHPRDGLLLSVSALPADCLDCNVSAVPIQQFHCSGVKPAMRLVPAHVKPITTHSFCGMLSSRNCSDPGGP